jgi:hypothetical protein
LKYLIAQLVCLLILFVCIFCCLAGATQVSGPVHFERRLHQLMLADEVQAWKQLTRLQRQHSLPFPGPVNTMQLLSTDSGDPPTAAPHHSAELNTASGSTTCIKVITMTSNANNPAA